MYTFVYLTLLDLNCTVLKDFNDYVWSLFLIINFALYACHFQINLITYRLVPSQDRHFFSTRYHLSALQNCALIFSTKFQFIFILKKCITQFSHWIVSCTVFVSKILYRYFIKITHSFVAIELLTFCKNAKKLFYCSRELSVFRT